MFVFILVMTVLVAVGCSLARADEYPPFNTRVGTQSFSPNYQFTDDPWLLETAKEIFAMGSDVFKFRPPKRPDGEKTQADSPRYALETNPVCMEILNMDFRTYFMWINATKKRNVVWRKGLSKENAKEVYDGIYDLASWFLETFQNTGKTFCIGHWEGDWLLHGTGKPETTPSETRIQGMIDWLNTRQQAIKDARRDHPAVGVKVYGYVEVNLVRKAIEGVNGDFTTVTNNVLPFVEMDLVSYSAYDSLRGPLDEMREFHRKALEHIASKALDSPDFGNQNVFVGEYGFRNRACPEQEKAERVAAIMEVNAAWGCPFTLYWQMYDNEYLDESKGICRGFWLINDRREKVPAYHVHQKYLAGINVLKNLYRFWLGRNPNQQETNDYGANFREFKPSDTLVEILDGAEYHEKIDNRGFIEMLMRDLVPASDRTKKLESQLCNALESNARGRSEILFETLDGPEFPKEFAEETFVKHLFVKMSGCGDFNIEQPRGKTIFESLKNGKKRSTAWLEALDSEQFALAELGDLRNEDRVDAPPVREKYWFIRNSR